MALLPFTTRCVLAAEQADPIKPSLGIRYDYDTNIYDSSTDAVESGIGIVTPTILLSTADERYTLLYAGDYGFYSRDSADNYTDHLLSGLAQFHLGSRGEVDLIAASNRGHWARGSHQTEGIDPSSPSFPTKPDVFVRNSWGSKFRYGAEGNRGRLRFGFGGSQLDNTNNRERTRYYDYETLFGSAGLSLSFHQRSAVVFDVVFTDVNYDETRPGEAKLDSEDWRYLAGVTWKATAKTAGSIRVGIQQRRFDDPALANASNPSWEADVQWSPSEDTKVGFITTRLTEETFNEAEFIDTTTYSVAWTRQWSQIWGSVVRWSQRDSDDVGSDQNQSLTEIYLGLRYPQGRLLTWEAGYTRRSNDSNIDNLVYDGNTFSIGVRIAN